MKRIPLIETGDAALVARAYDLGLKIAANVKNVLNEEELEQWEASLASIPDALHRGFCLPLGTAHDPQKSLGSTEEQLSSWISLFKDLGITLDPNEVKIPGRKPGFDRLIVVPKDMTAQKAFDLCLTRFSGACWRYTDKSLKSLDTVVPKNDRTAAKGSYAIWIRDRQEADVELQSLSANDLAEKKIKGITLCERLLFEIKYHAETGAHLDLKNWTLCSGSRAAGGYVPSVYWRGAGLDVDWDFPASRRSDLRAPAVVTL